MMPVTTVVNGDIVTMIATPLLAVPILDLVINFLLPLLPLAPLTLLFISLHPVPITSLMFIKATLQPAPLINLTIMSSAIAPELAVTIAVISVPPVTSTCAPPLTIVVALTVLTMIWTTIPTSLM